MHKTCACTSHLKSQHAEGSWAQDSTSNYGAIGNCELLGQGDMVFSKNIVSGRPTTLKWNVTCPRIVGMHKLVLKVFLCIGGVDNRVGCIKKSGSGKSERKEVNMIKRLCMKLSNNKHMVGEENNQKTL